MDYKDNSFRSRHTNKLWKFINCPINKIIECCTSISKQTWSSSLINNEQKDRYEK